MVANAPPRRGEWNAEMIKYLRTRLHYTQEQLARELNISNSTVVRWEGGKFLPQGLYIDALDNLAARNGITI
jgi:transcriptional regulator with XRE-family HTH domain